MTRTFIAVQISDGLRAAVAGVVARLVRHAPSFRWVAEENLHYTLHFLGDLTDTDVVEVCQRTQNAVKGLDPFTLSASGVGAFPSLDRPRTLWIGAGQGAEEMKRLHATIGDELDDMGFRAENRPYVPHLTIGKLGRTSRTKSLTEELGQFSDVQAGQMVVDQVTVFSSTLRPEGPEYTVMATAKL